jgi:hypothetical protein
LEKDAEFKKSKLSVDVRNYVSKWII